MKNKLTLLFFLVVLFVLYVLLRFFVFDRRAPEGKLKVLSSPGASVFINNSVVGKTPFEGSYQAGEYLIKLIPEGAATDTASWNDKITVYEHALTYVNRELGSSDIASAGEIFTTEKMKTPPKNKNNGQIFIETEPQGAIIFLDNDEKGVAPLILQDVVKGDHELSVFMTGFFRRTEKIKVDPGHQVNAKFKLAIDLSQGSVDFNEKKEATQSAKQGVKYVMIDSNPQGWLRVREASSVEATETAKIKPGEKYELLEKESGWYKIKYNNNPEGLYEGEFDEGWVSSQYSRETEE